MSIERSRRNLGTTTFAAITRDAGGAVVESLKDIAPDLSEWIMSMPTLRINEPMPLGVICFSGDTNRSKLSQINQIANLPDSVFSRIEARTVARNSFAPRLRYLLGYTHL
jgi:hypothetical protein